MPKLVQACRAKDFYEQLEPSWFNKLSTRRACTSLPGQTCLFLNHVSLNQYVDPASLGTTRRPRFLKQVVQTNVGPSQLQQACGVQKLSEPLLSWLHKRQARYTWNQTVLTRQAWSNKRPARAKWFKHVLTLHASISVLDQTILNNFSLACLLLN